jgi:hypothetical protein
METTNLPPLPEPVIIPGIMERIRTIKDRMSLEMAEMTYETLHRYLENKEAPPPPFSGNSRPQPKRPIVSSLA